jgi:hypothetical protein
MLNVDYESLLNEPEATFRAVCEFCEIPFQPSCMAFYDSTAPVQTMRKWQVHRPMYRTSIRRSEKYRDFLGSLLGVAVADERTD